MQATAPLDQGRAAGEGGRWAEAYDCLSDADRAAPLGVEDLDVLATAAYMLGRDDAYRAALERAHHAALEAGDLHRAVRFAFWIGLNFTLRGESSAGAGWFGRAQRLLDRDPADAVEAGYLLIPAMLRAVAVSDMEAAHAAAAAAQECGERFGDADLVAMSAEERAHALVRMGRAGEGLALLDETMVAATAGELSPIVTGLVYCNTIAFCHEVYELRRAREWTAALTRWCEAQPEMLAHTGVCLVHRAEIMQLSGAWPDALEEARRARERFAGLTNELAAGHALYRQAEVHRLRGEFERAEENYREASRHGWDPQPGLALLRLAQGNAEAAVAAIRRVVGETTDPLRRAGLLPAYVDILIEAGEAAEARAACGEFAALADVHDSELLGGMAAQARGSVELADGDPEVALPALRQATRVWSELDAPYEAARARVLVGLACRALGDGDAAALDFDAARAVFARLGAAPDLARLASLTDEVSPADSHGLTPRELEVLRLVAAGKSNREVAAVLVISEHTVARHVQNIFAKLGVSSRTAACAFALKHGLA